MTRTTTTRRRWGTLVPLAAALFLGALPAPAQEKPELKVEERTLSNGMRLLLYARHDEPTVSGGWVAHVGSANERPGITGISHLFEHMMFKGTPTIGLKDHEKNYAKDLQILADQERLRAEMRAEEARMRAALRRGDIDDIARPENKTARYKELEKQFDALVAAEREILAKNEFDRIYTRQGASGMNAFTNQDMTGYFVTVPKNKLELWFWMESDRLKSPVFREFYAERDVVFEERRLRTESTPTGRLEEAFDALFWHSHPYTWPVVGYPSDIPAITKAQADEYYGLYYAPNNLTAILVGDFDTKEAVEMAEKYFGRIPRGRTAPPEMTTLPAKWEAEVRFLGEADTNPEVVVRWHTVPFQHKDSYPLQVLAQILNGRTGRLYKGLVSPPGGPSQAVATEVSAAQSSQKYAGSFAIDGEARDGKTPEDVEGAIHKEIDRLKKELVPDKELQKVKNNFNATAFRRLSANFPILRQLIFSDGLGDWREINEGPKKVEAVTADDVRRVANLYLTKENRAVALVTRKAGAKPAGAVDEAALAAVPAESRAGVKKMIEQIVLLPAPQLQQVVAQLEAALPSAPPERRAGMELVLKTARERLAATPKTEKK